MKSIEIRSISVNAVQVIVKNQSVTEKMLTICIGDQLVVQPINKLSTKNRGRKCIIINFIYDDLRHISKAKVKFLDTNRNGQVLISDLAAEYDTDAIPSIPLHPIPEPVSTLPRYLPQDVPDHLFTQKELKFMGLVPEKEMEAFVFYPEQKREYKLFSLNGTRKQKQQSGMSLIPKKYTLEDVLNRRRHAIDVRKDQGMVVLRGK